MRKKTKKELREQTEKKYCVKCGSKIYHINQKTGICTNCKYPVHDFVYRDFSTEWENILFTKNIGEWEI
jgi:ribosomal protein L37E